MIFLIDKKIYGIPSRHCYQDSSQKYIRVYVALTCIKMPIKKTLILWNHRKIFTNTGKV